MKRYIFEFKYLSAMELFIVLNYKIEIINLNSSTYIKQIIIKFSISVEKLL